MASIDKRGNGKWMARWREYPGGPQRYRSFTRKVDAERHLVGVQHAVLTGTYVAPEQGRVTFAEWTELHLARQTWRPATYQSARASLSHSLAVLGHRPLNTIGRGDIRALLAGLDLAPSTVRLARHYLSSTLEAAVDDGLLARNPAKGVRVVPTERRPRSCHRPPRRFGRYTMPRRIGSGLRSRWVLRWGYVRLRQPA